MERTIGTGEAVRQVGFTVKILQHREREGGLVPAIRTESQLRAALESDHAAGAPDQD